VQDKYRFLDFHRIDRAICAAGVVFDHFQHAGTAKALEHFRGIVLVTSLRKGQRVTEQPPYVDRQRHEILVTARYPFERFFDHG
jgi:hypothetical protein